MIRIILLTISLVFSSSSGMNSQNISTIPDQAQGVSDRTYSRSVKILKETFKSIEKDEGRYSYADYWNIAIAYADMKQSPKIITELLFKSQRMNPENFSEICESFPETVASWSSFMSPEDFSKIKALARLQTADLRRNAERSHGTDTGTKDNPLQALLRKIKKSDQAVRSLNGTENVVFQRRVDKKNMRLVDSLYAHYGQYIGRDIVGEELAYVMWLIVQHSTLEEMKRYLPVIHAATVARQLPDEKPLKLLLDRIYAIEFKYQIFGTQVGVKVATPTEVARISKEYCLD